MKINKICPKFHFLTKKRDKNNLTCICVLLFTVSSPLEPFGSHFIDVQDFELYYLKYPFHRDLNLQPGL